MLPVIFVGFERILTFLSDCFDETGSNISTMPTEQGKGRIQRDGSLIALSKDTNTLLGLSVLCSGSFQGILLLDIFVDVKNCGRKEC